MRVLVAIPAKDEELTIGTVVALSKQYGDVLVVDDGSEDKVVKLTELSKAKQALGSLSKYAMKVDGEVVMYQKCCGKFELKIVG